MVSGNRGVSPILLFQDTPGEQVVASIREATNKAWVLGNNRFRLEIEDLLQRQAAPKDRGGDRRSLEFKSECSVLTDKTGNWRINRV